MKVLLIGATGNLGSRLVAALLSHNHRVVAFVRSPKKLETLLPSSVYCQLEVIQGSVNTPAIKSAILDSKCDAVVNVAGLASLAPWAHNGDLPQIFRAVLTAVQEAGAERRQPLRAWFIAGTGVLNYPGTETMLSSFIPIYLEHRQNYQLLKSLPAGAIDWSILCPNTMTPESEEIVVPAKSKHGKLIAGAGSPPGWRDSWMSYIPLIGKILVAGKNMPRYSTTLEQNADFIAADLEDGDSRWISAAVGIVDPAK